MHAGRIDFAAAGAAMDAQGERFKAANAATRVYLVLMTRPGEWFDSWELTLAAKTSAVGTRISELRSQAPAWLRIERKTENRRNFYRAECVPRTQLALGV